MLSKASGTVELNVINYFDHLKINIYNLEGQLVHSQSILDEFTLLEPNFEKGFYVFTVLSDNRLLTSGKFIVSD